MEQITTRTGITYSYEKSGTGPPLILVHGTLTTHLTGWMVVKPLFEPHFTVYAVDRRGRGETTATKGHTIRDEGADLAALVESIGDPVFLLGHSYGARVALAAAPMVTARLRKLALYEPPLPEVSLAAAYPRLMELAEKQDYEAVAYEFMRDVIRVPPEELEVLRNSPVWPLMVADVPASVAEWPALIDDPFDIADFKGLDLPVLLLTGSESPPEKYATDPLAAALPNASVEVLAGQGHGATFTAAQLFADIVTSFLLD